MLLRIPIGGTGEEPRVCFLHARDLQSRPPHRGSLRKIPSDCRTPAESAPATLRNRRIWTESFRTFPRKAALVNLNHQVVFVLPRQGSLVGVSPAGQVDPLTRIHENHEAVSRERTEEKRCCRIPEISILRDKLHFGDAGRLNAPFSGQIQDQKNSFYRASSSYKTVLRQVLPSRAAVYSPKASHRVLFMVSRLKGQKAELLLFP